MTTAPGEIVAGTDVIEGVSLDDPVLCEAYDVDIDALGVMTTTNPVPCGEVAVCRVKISCHCGRVKFMFLCERHLRCLRKGDGYACIGCLRNDQYSWTVA